MDVNNYFIDHPEVSADDPDDPKIRASILKAAVAMGMITETAMEEDALRRLSKILRETGGGRP